MPDRLYEKIELAIDGHVHVYLASLLDQRYEGRSPRLFRLT